MCFHTQSPCFLSTSCHGLLLCYYSILFYKVWLLVIHFLLYLQEERMKSGLEISTKMGWLESKQKKKERHFLPFYIVGLISQNIAFQSFPFSMTVLLDDMFNR